MKVPKLEVSVMVSRELGIAAKVSCELNPKLENRPWGKAAILASVGALPSAKTKETAMTPMTAEMTARVQMARRGERDPACNMPKCSGASSSLPMARSEERRVGRGRSY